MPKQLAVSPWFLSKFTSTAQIVESVTEEKQYMGNLTNSDRDDYGLVRYSYFFRPTEEFAAVLRNVFPNEAKFSFEGLKFFNTGETDSHVPWHTDLRPATLVLNFIIDPGSDPNRTETHISFRNVTQKLIVPKNHWCCFDTRMLHRVRNIQPHCCRHLLTVGLFNYTYLDLLRAEHKKIQTRLDTGLPAMYNTDTNNTTH